MGRKRNVGRPKGIKFPRGYRKKYKTHKKNKKRNVFGKFRYIYIGKKTIKGHRIPIYTPAKTAKKYRW